MAEEVLGVKPTAPGFAKVLIEPKWADLEFARGTVPTPKGPIEVSWQKNKALEISIPAVEADVVVHTVSGPRKQHFTGPGRHIIEVR